MKGGLPCRDLIRRMTRHSHLTISQPERRRSCRPRPGTERSTESRSKSETDSTRTHSQPSDLQIPTHASLGPSATSCPPVQPKRDSGLLHNILGLRRTWKKKMETPFMTMSHLSLAFLRIRMGHNFWRSIMPVGASFSVFPDGSAQVFYPSGFLALVIISDGRERVCIVHDDHSLGQPIRALFQSDGRATCYHGNGNVWLSLDASGGQCLNDAGARIRRWRWRGHSQTPTPLRPLFLSLNRSLGVRVLGQEHMFVSFLSAGQQAKFSVGACLQPFNSNCFKVTIGLILKSLSGFLPFRQLS
uniref:uncharacterized protein LOC124041988 isoform X4 n=1 Tax=Oncorhynchus gorbuscha TaxID=8017 RepID=UPI001EAE8434|nr:uncharacterized protein LOC124041988 isoform X4 [Oncorhynchus gorbuscha]